MPRVLLFSIILWMFTASPVQAQSEDVDWTVRKTKITEAGPGTPVQGTRWSIGSQRDEVFFALHFDLKTDKTHGVWYGEIQSREKFYSSLSTVTKNGLSLSYKVDNARARGPDAEDWGGWKEGPSTVPIQSMIFELDRERVNRLTHSTNMVMKYTRFVDKNDVRNIDFPLESFKARLDEIDADIAEYGGGFFLKTRNEVENMPFGHLPSFVSDPMMKELKTISEKTGKPISDLIHLSINDIKKASKDADKAKDEARLAEIKAKHKAI